MDIKKYMTTKNMSIIALTAGIYTSATIGLAPISYSIFQFRISEVLNLLAFLNPVYAFGVILGCFISNFYSPLGMIDVVIGTTATALTVFCITRTKNLFVATLWPTFFCFLIGFEFWILEGAPFFLTTGSIMLGEFAVVTLVGYPLFRAIMANKRLYAVLSLRDEVLL